MKASFKMPLAIGLVMVIVLAATGCVLFDDEDESITVVTLGPIDMQASLESGEIAGYVAWEPYCSDTIVNENGKALRVRDTLLRQLGDGSVSASLTSTGSQGTPSRTIRKSISCFSLLRR